VLVAGATEAGDPLLVRRLRRPRVAATEGQRRPAGPEAIRGAGTRCTPGISGRGLFLDGSAAALVDAPVRPDFRPTRLSVSISVRPWHPPDSAIVGRWFVLDSFLMVFDAHASQYTFSAAVPSPANEFGDSISASAPAEDDTWVHLVGVFDGSAVRLYKDGQLAAETPVPNGPRDLQDTLKSLTMGHLQKDPPPQPAEPTFRGDIDELHIYDVALTAEQIAGLRCGS